MRTSLLLLCLIGFGTSAISRPVFFDVSPETSAETSAEVGSDSDCRALPKCEDTDKYICGPHQMGSRVTCHSIENEKCKVHDKACCLGSKTLRPPMKYGYFGDSDMGVSVACRFTLKFDGRTTTEVKSYTINRSEIIDYDAFCRANAKAYAAASIAVSYAAGNYLLLGTFCSTLPDDFQTMLMDSVKARGGKAVLNDWPKAREE